MFRICWVKPVRSKKSVLPTTRSSFRSSPKHVERAHGAIKLAQDKELGGTSDENVKITKRACTTQESDACRLAASDVIAPPAGDSVKAWGGSAS